MDQRKIGKFIQELRKKKGFTREELALRLNVSSKSISRWENGMLLLKRHGYYYDANTNVYTKFSFKIRKC